MTNNTDFTNMLSRYRYTIAIVLFLTGVVLRLLHSVFHKEGVAWEILGDLGTFLALIIAVHFLYELFVKKYEHKVFLEDMQEEMERALSGFQKSTSAQMHAEIDTANQAIGLLKGAVEKLGEKSLQIEYMKVNDLHDGRIITEAHIYRRAIDEIRKAHESIDIFTSYLLEVDDKSQDAIEARSAYFTALLSLFGGKRGPFRYRRLVQAPKDIDLEDAFSTKADTYLNHIKDMVRMERNGQNIHVKFIDRRRPTTFAVIDKKILLWQINQVGLEGDMQIYGMYIMEDPGQIFIKHFHHEFEHYWDSEARPVKVHITT